MGQGARLTSIDAVQDMAAAIQSFRSEAASALDDLEMEIRRALDWIHHDRKEFWEREVRRGWEKVTESRVQLHQAMTARRVADHEPSCYDEKKAIERAKRRLDVAMEKVEAVRHWQHVIDHAVNEFRGSRTQVSGWLDSDFPKAMSALNRMKSALEAYLMVRTADTPAEFAASSLMAALEPPQTEQPQGAASFETAWADSRGFADVPDEVKPDGEAAP